MKQERRSGGKPGRGAGGERKAGGAGRAAGGAGDQSFPGGKSAGGFRGGSGAYGAGRKGVGGFRESKGAYGAGGKEVGGFRESKGAYGGSGKEAVGASVTDAEGLRRGQSGAGFAGSRPAASSAASPASRTADRKALGASRPNNRKSRAADAASPSPSRANRAASAVSAGAAAAVGPGTDGLSGGPAFGEARAPRLRSDVPVRVGETVTAEVIGISHEGQGVGRYEGFTLFIPGALPGERVRAKVVHVKKQFGHAELAELVDASPDRREPPCPVYDRCGGCQLQHLDYAAQLAWKRQLVVDQLERIGKLRVAGSERVVGADDSGSGIAGGSGSDGRRAGTDGSGIAGGKPADVEMDEAANSSPAANKPLVAAAEAGFTVGQAGAERPGGSGNADADLGNNSVFGGAPSPAVVVHPTLGMDEPWRYRNKVQVPIGEEEGGLVGGFYAQGTHRIIDMDSCLIQHEQGDEVVRKVKEIARGLGIRPYREETHSGLLRHVVVRIGYRTGEIMVVLVTNGESIPRMTEWIDAIREDIPGVTSICQNVNTRRTNVIFGERTEVLWGREVIYDLIGDIRFAISARSFYQVNPVQTELLYAKALEYAGLTGEETVIDAYCGIGTISLFLARKARRVYGVEIVPEAIEDARANAALNGITNAEFAVGAAEAVLPAWRRDGIVADVIVVDPPRKGCDPLLLSTLAEMRPHRIVYVSCNPATLARDLRILEDSGYRTVEVQPVDMFPWTVHVEAVCLLVRNGTDC